MPRSYLTDLICTACGAAWSADEPHGVCPTCGKVLFAQYDLAALRAAMPAPDFAGRDWDLWRYRELLPIRDDRHAVSPGEGGTPLAPAARAAAAVGLDSGGRRATDEGGSRTGPSQARRLELAGAGA